MNGVQPSSTDSLQTSAHNYLAEKRVKKQRMEDGSGTAAEGCLNTAMKNDTITIQVDAHSFLYHQNSSSAAYLLCMYCLIDFLNTAAWTNNPPICGLNRTKLITVANSAAYEQGLPTKC